MHRPVRLHLGSFACALACAGALFGLSGRLPAATVLADPRPGDESLCGRPRLIPFIDDKVRRGVFVFDLSPAGSPYRAGLRHGDLVTRVDDVQVTTADEVASALQRLALGDRVRLTVERDGLTWTLASAAV